MMSFFEVSTDSCIVGFQSHIEINLIDPIDIQIRKIILTESDKLSKEEIGNIIYKNSSLRISFGWSFESSQIFREIMHECLLNLNSKYNLYMGNLITDMRCSWLGFVPFNPFEMEVCLSLNEKELIEYNNLLVQFQIEVLVFLTSNKHFQQHSLLRADNYRFHYFKKIRNQPVELSKAFCYYIEATMETTGINMVLREEIEQQIGCHYLYFPDVFFESLEFYKLKGIIYEQ